MIWWFCAARPRPIDDAGECLICCESRASILFIPCQHQIACIQCSSRMKKCLQCHSPISNKIGSGNNFSNLDNFPPLCIYCLIHNINIVNLINAAWIILHWVQPGLQFVYVIAKFLMNLKLLVFLVWTHKSDLISCASLQLLWNICWKYCKIMGFNW